MPSVPNLQSYLLRTMALNESPYPPSAAVLEAAAAAVGSINRAPDLMVGKLSAAIAEKFSVPAQNVVVGPGSATLLQMLVMLRCAGGGELMYGWPTFDMYPFLCGLGLAEAVQIPLVEHRHDVDGMLAAATDDLRVAIVCQPNNPTGTTLDKAELSRLVSGLPAGTTIVIDEAYREFADPDGPDGLDVFRADERVCVSRTFSKAHSLFGLRVGYLIAHEPVASQMRLLLGSFMVNSIGQAAALAALDTDDEMRQRCALIVAERERLHAELIEQGYDVPHSQGNFLWIPLRDGEVERFTARCQEDDVLVRGYPGLGVRVAVDEPESNARLLELTRGFALDVARPMGQVLR